MYSKIDSKLDWFFDYIGQPEPATCPGDFNEDGSDDVMDVIALVNLVLSDNYDDSYDLNNDNSVDVLDTIATINIILYGDNECELY